MPYYLGRFRGEAVDAGGVAAMRCWPDGLDPGEPHAIIDLRLDGGATVAGAGLNACLVYTPAAVVHAALTPLADLADERLSRARQSDFARINVIPSEDRLDRIVLGLMVAPPSGGWRPVREDRRGLLKAKLGPLVAEMRPIRGGAVVDTEAFTNAVNDTELDAHDAVWVTMSGHSDLLIESNAAGTSGTSYRGNRNNTDTTWADDQYAEAVVVNRGNLNMAVCVRCATAAVTWYGVGYTSTFAGNTNDRLWKFVGFAYTSLDATSAGPGPLAATDVIYLEAQGTALAATLGGANWLSATDSEITAGQPALWARSSPGETIALWDDFEGGDFVAAPGGSKLTRAFPLGLRSGYPRRLIAGGFR